MRPSGASWRRSTRQPPVPRLRSDPPSEGVIPNNLPMDRTRFIGRETELAACAQLLGEARLLTVTGIGGSGKTRLAVKLAASLLQSYPDGVWLVDLSPLREASRVAETIASTLTIGEEPGKSLLETVVHYVSGKRLLLMLDNCEHLVEATAVVVDALLQTSDDVRVLTTSRESLGIAGERLFALRSLTLPSAKSFDLNAVKSSDAVRLFVDRAHIADPGRTRRAECAAGGGDLPAADGIPLAIELAAARVKMLSVEEISSRLDDRFRLLTSGNKTLQRHQTLRAAYQWSCDLLTAEEQRLFRMLAVFAGGWTLEAATAIWSDAADEIEVLEMMTRLADKSLVMAERRASGTSRYRMLEMSRQFAQEKLNEAGEADAARAGHLKYFLAWAEKRESMTMESAFKNTARGVEQRDWLTQVGHESQNLLSALECCARGEDGKHGLQLARHVAGYRTSRGMYGVGRERLGAALRLPAAESLTSERAAVLVSMGYMAWKQGALAEARACHEESLTLSRNSGDSHSIIVALEGLGWVSFDENDPGAARACFEEALALARDTREGHLIGLCLNALAFLAWERGDLAQARAHWEDALAAVRDSGNRWSIAVVLSNLTDVALRNGAWEEVRGNLSEALGIVRELGLRSSANQILKQSSSLAAAVGDTTRAAGWYGAAAALEHAVGIKRHFHRELHIRSTRSREAGRRRVRAGWRQRRRARLRGGIGGGTGLAGESGHGDQLLETKRYEQR